MFIDNDVSLETPQPANLSIMDEADCGRQLTLSSSFVRKFLQVFLAIFLSQGVVVTSDANAQKKHVAVFSIPSGNPALERNKTNVMAFYDLMFNQSRPADAMRLYGGATYTQHNPEVPDGKGAFIAFFEKMAKDSPGKSVEFKRVFAEGQFVTLHSAHYFPGMFGGTWAAIDIFRLDDQGKVVEHWDVLQKVPAKAAHNNGMF
jgi:predicted SnoaL-like aldol condensation-catalyzing enzyme